MALPAHGAYRVANRVLLAAFLGLGTATACAPVPNGPPPPVPSAPAGPSAAFGGEPLRVLSHCLIRSTRWRGRFWVAENPRGAAAPTAGPDGVAVEDGYTSGTMTALGPNLAVFTSSRVREPVRFRPGVEPTGGQCA